ncbi:MAG: PEGA domain-containing protein, partial [Kofleriaceae bacterium]
RVDGLVVRRDSEIVEAAGWSTPLPVDPGSYTVTAEAPGYTTWRQVVTVAPGAKREVIAVPTLERAPVAAAPSEATPVWPPPQAPLGHTTRVTAARGPWTKLRVASAVLGIAGVGALGTGVYFGVHASSLQDRSDKLCPGTLCASDEGLRLNDQAKTSASRANILYVAGGASLAAAAVLWFVGAPGETVIRPTMGNQGYGVSMAGSF